MYKQITVFLDPENDPPQYIYVIKVYELKKIRKSDILSKTIVHPGGTIKNVEEALVQASIPELEKLFDQHMNVYITIYCSLNSTKNFLTKSIVKYPVRGYIYCICNPNMIKKFKLKEKVSEEVQEKNTDIILLHL